jgi:hypothetical protein
MDSQSLAYLVNGSASGEIRLPEIVLSVPQQVNVGVYRPGKGRAAFKVYPEGVCRKGVVQCGAANRQHITPRIAQELVYESRRAKCTYGPVVK